MSDEQRITGEQQASAQQQENQELDQASAEQAQLDGIPEKFLNKSPLDIIRSYNEVEKSYSKVSSERAQERKAREELEAKYKDLESRFNAMQSQSSSHEEDEPQAADPFQEYDEQFEQDPKKAIKSLVGETRAQIKQERQLMEQELSKREAFDYYTTQKKDNPEYAKLEPTMVALANEYGDLVRKDKADSIKALKLLHLAAKGAKLEEYLSEAASKAKKESTTIKDEKRQAFSESGSNSQGSKAKDFKDLTVEEWEKLVPVARY